MSEEADHEPTGPGRATLTAGAGLCALVAGAGLVAGGPPAAAATAIGAAVAGGNAALIVRGLSAALEAGAGGPGVRASTFAGLAGFVLRHLAVGALLFVPAVVLGLPPAWLLLGVSLPPAVLVTWSLRAVRA